VQTHDFVRGRWWQFDGRGTLVDDIHSLFRATLVLQIFWILLPNVTYVHSTPRGDSRQSEGVIADRAAYLEDDICVYNTQRFEQLRRISKEAF
jgi:hypothetical protein